MHFAPNPTLPATEQWVGELLRERDLGQAGRSSIRSMRRLLVLTPLLLVGACGSSDLTFTSEVGEKVIVKRETIQQISDSSNKSVAKSRANLYASDKRRLARLKPGDFNYDAYLKSIRGFETLNQLNKRGVWYKEFRYIPIKVDLNGTKTVGTKKFVICPTPSLTPKERKTLADGLYTNHIVNGSIGDPIANKICEEYAAFDK